MGRFARVWLIFTIVATTVLVADYAYVRWRERSLEPLSVPIDLTRSATYSFEARGFHGSRYHPEFALHLPFATDAANWFSDDSYRELWSGSPPIVQIDVHDRSGRRVLSDRGPITRTNGWIVTGSPASPFVEVYKFAEFDARIFESYRVRLTVVRGSPVAARYQTRFEIAAIKAYALLPAELGFVALIAAVVITAFVIAVVQLIVVRRRRNLQCSTTCSQAS